MPTSPPHPFLVSSDSPSQQQEGVKTEATGTPEKHEKRRVSSFPWSAETAHSETVGWKDQENQKGTVYLRAQQLSHWDPEGNQVTQGLVLSFSTSGSALC